MTEAEMYSTIFQVIGLILSTLTFIGSIIAIYFTYQNLKEMRKQLQEQKDQYFEQNRGNLIFYITRSDTSVMHSLIIKNFGNSPAKLINLKIDPKIDWNKSGEPSLEAFNVTNLKNVLLAPSQNIASCFDFRNYPDKVFNIEISYETCGKTFIDAYTIDIDCLGQVVHMEPQIKDEISALKNIYKAITALSEKFI